MKKFTEELKTTLTSLGLSDKEAAVYISLLELGRGRVSTVARRAGMNRTTGYDILASLLEKGLVTVSGKEPVEEYAAESPEALARFFDREIETKKNQKEKALSVIPQLLSLEKKQNRPTVKFYEGVDGIKSVYEDTLTAQETIRAFGSYEIPEATIPAYFPRYYKRRAERGISIKGIAPNTPVSQKKIELSTEEKRELVLVPPDEFTPHPEINVYDNKTMIASWSEKLGIIIESAEIADAMKKMFELAWIGARTLEKKD